LGLVARCLIIRTAVTILRGVSVATVSIAVRLRLIDMLEREAAGYCDHGHLMTAMDPRRNRPSATPRASSEWDRRVKP
jgi:hypothetical protein